MTTALNEIQQRQSEQLGNEYLVLEQIRGSVAAIARLLELGQATVAYVDECYAAHQVTARQNNIPFDELPPNPADLFRRSIEDTEA